MAEILIRPSGAAGRSTETGTRRHRDSSDLWKQKKSRVLGGGELDIQTSHRPDLQALDPAFVANVSDGSTRTHALAVQSDGKVILGGGGIINGVTRTGPVRLNQDGSVDTSFTPDPTAFAEDLKIQSDGKILIAGSITGGGGVRRYNPDGSADGSFSVGSGANGAVNNIAIQADGKVLVVGNFTQFNGTARSRVARLNSDGSLDAGFNIAPLVSSQTVEAVAIQPDGKILVSGSFSAGSIVRLNSDGARDTSFQAPGNLGVLIQTIAVQTDGKVLIGGTAEAPFDALARLNADGSLDNSFNAEYPASGTGSSVHRLILLADGRILAGGSYESANGDFYHVVRFTASGSLDSSFTLRRSVGGNGFPEAFGMGRSSDGRIVIAGDFYSVEGSTNKRVVRFEGDGTVDSGFAVSLEGPGRVEAIARQADGKLLAAGEFKYVNGQPRTNVIRLDAGGSLDPSFAPAIGESTVTAIAPQPDGKTVIGGSFLPIQGAGPVSVARLNSDGSRDSSFASNLQSPAVVRSLILQPDGKLLAGGFFYSDDFATTRGLVRLNSNGTRDNSFVDTPGTSQVNDLARTTDGKFYAAGSFASYGGRARIARLNPDGSVDTTFNPGTGANSAVNSVAIQPDGKILIGGTFTSFNSTPVGRVARLNPNGSIDTSFVSGTGFDGTVSDIAVLPNGEILVGGLFTAYNGTTRSRLAKLAPDGSLTGLEITASNLISAVHVQPDSRIVIGGTFTSVNGESRLGLARLLSYPSEACETRPITIGQSAGGALGSESCLVGTDKTDSYTFTGAANQHIAVSMETSQFFSKIELVSPTGAVVATAGGVNGVNNSRLPASGFFTLPSAGTYTIRAIAAFGGSGSYTLSLFEAPAAGSCTYSVSPVQTDVPAGGGTFFFDAVTQPGCPPAAQPTVPAGAIYSNLTYAGGRVTFTVSPNPNAAARTDTITVAGQTHTIKQFGNTAPPNDAFAAAETISGANSPPNSPTRGYNTAASAENGEPAHAAGQPAQRSVWYSWAAPANGLWSFSTSGSSFDTVMAIYRCPATGACTLANMVQVGSNDDTTAFDTTSKVNFRADQGRTYMIAVDGKNGATGTIELSWRQYRRLFRLYLQTYNGDQSPLVPDSVTASNGAGSTIVPLLVSLGVYEFDLPADDSVYTVNISGPTGIVWNPNNFALDTSFRYLDELMRGDGTGLGGENSVSNAQFETPRFIYGFIKYITAADIADADAGLSVTIGSSRGPNPREEVPCGPLAPQTIAGAAYAAYQCVAQPNTIHDILPSMSGRNFTISALSFDAPVTATYAGTPGTSFIASPGPTSRIAGRVLAGGAGTQVDLTYTPAGNTSPITLRRTTDATGAFRFANLPRGGTYRMKVTRPGAVFPVLQPIDLTGDTDVDVAPEAACTFAPAGGVVTIPTSGGLAQLNIAASAASCGWAAASDSAWITINSGETVGNGPVHFTAQPNTGPGRIGSIRIRGRLDPVLVQQATNAPTFGTIAGRVLTPSGVALRNAAVTLIDAAGTRRTATTSSFGVYTFDNVQLGAIYSATVASKRYRFAPKNIPFTAGLSDVNFVGLE
jgi:uncharacterized delta-60 repeat protein